MNNLDNPYEEECDETSIEEEMNKALNQFTEEQRLVKEKVKDAEELRTTLLKLDRNGAVEVETEMVATDRIGDAATFSIKAWATRLNKHAETLIKRSFYEAEVSYDDELECFVINASVEIAAPE